MIHSATEAGFQHAGRGMLDLSRFLSNVLRRLFSDKVSLSLFAVESRLKSACRGKGPEFFKALAVLAKTVVFEPELAKPVSADRFLDGLLFAAEKILQLKIEAYDQEKALGTLKASFKLEAVKAGYDKAKKPGTLPALKLAAIIRAFCRITLDGRPIAEMTEADFVWAHAAGGLDIGFSCRLIETVRGLGIRAGLELADNSLLQLADSCDLESALRERFLRKKNG